MKIDVQETEVFINTFQALRNGGTVRRYHTHYTAQTDTVASHSWGVATLVDMLYGGAAPAHMLRAALHHDIAEYRYGDIPSPTKRLLHNMDLKKYEDIYMRDVGLFTELTDMERQLLKIADMLEGACFCSEELVRGNRAIIDIVQKYLEYANECVAKLACDVEKFSEHAELLDCAALVTGKIVGCIHARIKGAMT